jgi:hypothetical protein
VASTKRKLIPKIINVLANFRRVKMLTDMKQVILPYEFGQENQVPAKKPDSPYSFG